MIFLSFTVRNAHCSTIFSSLLCWANLILSCNGHVNWIFPGPEDSGLTFNYIDTVYFTWTSNITDPWMNLWCAPNQTTRQSSTYVYHSEVPTNGINPQSFPYSEYNKDGICHMQIEDFSGDDFANTPTFDLTSQDGVSPVTWGATALGQSSGTTNPTTAVSLPSTRALPTSPSTSSSVSPTPASSSSSSSSSPSFTSTFSVSITSPSSSLAKPSSTTSSAIATTRAATPLASPSSSPSKQLSAAAKAGISIGSIGCALMFTITLILCRNARSRRIFRHGEGEGRHPYPLDQIRWQEGSRAAEVGEGVLNEVNGLATPPELHGNPRAELF